MNLSTYEYLEQGWPFTFLVLVIPLAENVLSYIYGFVVVWVVTLKPKLQVLCVSVLVALVIFGSSYLLSRYTLLRWMFVIFFISPFITVYLAKTARRLVPGRTSAPRQNLFVNPMRLFFPSAPTVLVHLVTGLFLFVGVGYLAILWGENIGRKRVTETAMQIQLVSSEPLLLGSTAVITTEVGSDTLYSYSGLRLLIENNGRYFVYNRVGASCKPEQVFVIREDELKTVQLGSPSPLAANCTLPLATTPPPATPVHTPTIQITATP